MAKKDDELIHRAERTEDGWRFRFRFLVRKEEDWFVAYCLELDLVAAAKTKDQAVQEIRDLTRHQVEYCIVNDNMDRLFRRAPEEIWAEYYACEEKPTQKPRPLFSFIESTCLSQSLSHAR